MPGNDETAVREQIRSIEEIRQQTMLLLAELDQTMARSKAVLATLQADRLSRTRERVEPFEPE